MLNESESGHGSLRIRTSINTSDRINKKGQQNVGLLNNMKMSLLI